MLRRMYSPRRMPLTASTIFPAQSMPMPYSQRSPGSNRSGMRSATFLPEPARGRSMAFA